MHLSFLNEDAEVTLLFPSCYCIWKIKSTLQATDVFYRPPLQEVNIRKVPLPHPCQLRHESYGYTSILVFPCKSSLLLCPHPHLFTLGQIQSTLLEAQGALRSPPSLLPGSGSPRSDLSFFTLESACSSWRATLFYELSCSISFPAPQHMLKKPQAPTPNTEVLPR